MKKILILFLITIITSVFAADPFLPNTEYENMLRGPMSIEIYKFINSSEFNLIQQGGDYTLTKGEYKFDKDDFGPYILFTSKYFNFGSDEDNKYDPPVKSKYYISNNKDMFILFKLGKKNYDNSFQAYSTANYFIEGRYTATSTLIENKKNPDLYNPEKMSSKYYLNEFWSEGTKGYGIGEKISIDFIPFEFEDSGPDVKKVPVNISGVIIFNGVLKSKDLYYKNSRIKKITIKYSNGNSENITLKDTYIPQIINLKKADGNITNAEITINDIYKGSKWDDTCITKILFYGIYE